MNHIIQIYRKWPLRKSYIFSLEGVRKFTVHRKSSLKYLSNGLQNLYGLVKLRIDAKHHDQMLLGNSTNSYGNFFMFWRSSE